MGNNKSATFMVGMSINNVKRAYNLIVLGNSKRAHDLIVSCWCQVTLRN